MMSANRPKRTLRVNSSPFSASRCTPSSGSPLARSSMVSELLAKDAKVRSPFVWAVNSARRTQSTPSRKCLVHGLMRCPKSE